MNEKLLVAFLMLIAVPSFTLADVITDLQAKYRSQGAVSVNAAAGEAMWTREAKDAKTGEMRSCSTCHTRDLKKPGKHASTGKIIDAMAPSANRERLGDPAKIEKWFARNCKWTYGRECSAQEKTDFLAYISSR